MSTETKYCPGCETEKALADFYRTKVQVLTLCKCCHNRACARRVRKSPTRRAQQYGAKRRWTLAHPIEKAIHEKRTIFCHQSSAPQSLKRLEAVTILLNREVWS